MKYTVLIVDDIADNINVAANILISNYINVGIAQNGEDALVYAQNNKPDLILLDIMMPEMDGYEVCQKLKENPKTSEIPIIFLSAKNEQKNIIKAFQYGGVDYISKPFFEEEFIARVRTQLDLRKSKLGLVKELNHRTKIQENLQKSEEKLRAIINSIPDLIFYKDTDSKYTGCNQAFADFMNVKIEDILGKTDYDFYDTDEAQIFLDSDKKVLKSGHDAYYQEWITDSQHRQVFLDTRKSAMRNKKGEVFGIVGVSRDVTVLKNTERELKEKQEYLKSIFESLSDLIFIIDRNGFFSSFYAPEGDENLYALPDIFLGEHYSEVLPKKLSQKLKESIDLVYSTNKVQQFDYELKIEDKTEWFNAKLSVYKDVNGNYNGVTAVVRDITQRKINENKLKIYVQKVKETTERYELLANNMTDFIWMMDMNMKGIYISPSCHDFLGYTPEELGENAIYKIHPPSSINKIKKAIKYRIENPDLVTKTNLEIEYIHKNGTVFPAEVLGQIIYDDKGKPIAVGGVSRNISERKKTEQELENYKNHLEELVEQRTKELKLSETKFKNIFNASKDAIFITDIVGNFLEANEVSCKRTGLSFEELKRSNLIIFHKKDKIENYFEKIKHKEDAVFTGSYISKNNIKIYIEMFGKLIDYNNQIAVLHVSRDITERKEIQKEILKSVIKTEEKERERFAKDLHDGLGAKLSAVKMYLNLLGRTELSKEEETKIINEAIELIDMSSKSAKEIAVNMRPHELAHFGLIQSLQSFCERINRIGKVKINCITDKFNADLDEEKELFIFRIVSELINNTLKYANAQNIDIDIFSDDNNIFIKYKDDGIGFDINKIIGQKEGAGLGIGNIINRTETLGGKVKFKSKIGKGMSADITINQ